MALETFGKRIVGNRKYPALRGILNDGLGLLLRRRALSAEQLVEVLTLMDPVVYSGPEEDDPQILGHEFWQAFRALRLGQVDQLVSDGLAYSIWRRAMIRDDWIVLNDTTDKNDDEVTAAMTQTGLFRTLFDYYEHALRHPEDSGALKLLSPSQVLEGETFPQQLQKRFRENEIGLVQRDLGVENEILKTYVEKGRIELHYGGLLKIAQAAAKAEAERAGEEAGGDD